MRSDDGVGAVIAKRPTEQSRTGLQASLPTALLKVDGEHKAQTRSLVGVGGTISVNPTPHIVDELTRRCSVDVIKGEMLKLLTAVVASMVASVAEDANVVVKVAVGPVLVNVIAALLVDVAGNPLLGVNPVLVVVIEN